MTSVSASEPAWLTCTVFDDFRAQAAARPDKVAIVADHAAGGREVLSFRQLARLVERCAGALRALEVQPGEVVSLQLPNSWEFTALALACARIGAVVNPIVPILRRREVGFILERTGCRVCVMPDYYRGFAHGAMLAELAAELPTLAHPFVIGTPPARTRDFAAHFLATRWEDQVSAAELDALAPKLEDLAEIQFTSGTTGEPKGVMHSHQTLQASMRAAPEMLGLTRDDVVLMASTMAHQTGFLYGLLMPTMLGMKVVYQDLWDPHRMLELVEDEGVTWTMGATPFALDAVAAQRERPRNVSSLRLFTCAGAPVPPHLVDASREVLGATLIAGWGMTENGLATATRPDDPPDRAAASDGRPVSWMQVRVVDEQDQPLAVGQTGRLQVRGRSQCLGYYQRPDLYAAATTADGWFDTGDLARLDPDGGIRIAGRTKDLIIRGGENVPVAEVEAVLYRHPAVREVAVVGVPDPRLGERACAVVVSQGEPPTLDLLKAHLEAAGVAKPFWPERLAIVAEMPKTPSGKIQKFRLREQAASAASLW